MTKIAKRTAADRLANAHMMFLLTHDGWATEDWERAVSQKCGYRDERTYGM
jgi:hypothetical protein